MLSTLSEFFFLENDFSSLPCTYSGMNAQSRCAHLCKAGGGNADTSRQLSFTDQKQALPPPTRSLRAGPKEPESSCCLSLGTFKHSMPELPIFKDDLFSVKVAFFKNFHRTTIIMPTELATFPITFIEEEKIHSKAQS